MRDYIVPQEFNQDDRIGNFTIPQAFILGAGVLSGMLLLSLVPIIFALLLDIPIAIATVYLMYKKKYNVPIYEFAFVFLMFKATPKLLIYRKDNMRDEYIDEEVKFQFEDDEDEEKELELNKKSKKVTKKGVKKNG